MLTGQRLETRHTGTSTYPVEEEITIPCDVHYIDWILCGVTTRIQTAHDPIRVSFEFKRDTEVLKVIFSDTIDFKWDPEHPEKAYIPICSWKLERDKIRVWEGDKITVIRQNFRGPVVAPITDVEFRYA